MVIDCGVEHGIHAGQRLTLFRRRLIDPAKPSVVGEAVVVATRGDSATIRVEAITDVIVRRLGGAAASIERGDEYGGRRIQDGVRDPTTASAGSLPA